MNDEKNDGNFLDRIKESPRTVSALIIILIVAAAIYAFSGTPQQTTNEPTPSDEAMNTAIDESPLAMSPSPSARPAAPTLAPRTPVSQQQLQDMRSRLPEGTREGDAYVEKAQAGEGITHLARRATTRWLADNAAGYEITNEHRIYIEDYIQNKLGTDRLEVGETRTVSFALIAEAVEHAGQLNDTQLHHLSSYTGALR